MRYLDNDVNKLKTNGGELQLELIDKKYCVKVYKIIKHYYPDFIKGELYHDLKTNQITFSRTTKDFYDKNKIVVRTSILNKCGKCWRGPNIYTEGLQGETSILEFRFL